MKDGTYVPWSLMTQSGLRPLQDAMNQKERSTKVFRCYQSHLVPGLLQTPAYAAAVMGAIIAFEGMPDDTEEAVAARMRRQHVLHEDGLTFMLLIEEWVLRAQIGGATVMGEQLDRLDQVTAMPRVSLGVIPMNATRPMRPVAGFWIYDDAEVTHELCAGSVRITTPAEIDIYARTHAELAGMAVYGEQARALIEDARAALG
ncbi:DUF5753 domain-containing protein [Streptomyces youssoufiensis]